ncbi:MAG TPA: CheR family methyltransferase, partial [Kofleriaceae bacterium]|nr:CheR family methyltransferase [Kofleriaceae bacterium]
LRAMVEVAEVNLAAERLPLLPPFDLVLMRNVLVYFDPPTRLRVLAHVRDSLAPDGVLVLGAAEVTPPASAGFSRVVIDDVVFYRPEGHSR